MSDRPFLERIRKVAEHRDSTEVTAELVRVDIDSACVKVGGVKFLVYERSQRLMIYREDGGLDIGWAELQAIKTRIWGDVPAAEVYPRRADLVDNLNARHLWRLSDEAYAPLNLRSRRDSTE